MNPSAVRVNNASSQAGSMRIPGQDSANPRVCDRALSKVRCSERGHHYVEERLRGYGAKGEPGRNPSRWLTDALNDIGAVRVRRPGKWRYATATTPAHRRALRRRLTALPYPKAHAGGLAEPIEL